MNSSLLTPLRIGTRGSPLALTQANIVLNLLKEVHPTDPAIQNAVLITVTTTGDRIRDRPLSEIGGKGLFSKELEQSLQANEIDCVVHSLKDMETVQSRDLTLCAFLNREDARDILLSPRASCLKTLAPGSIVGTCAPRRVAQILHHRPDLHCIPLRGNVDTRIRKLHEGEMDAIILALAGLKRLGRQDEATYIFSEQEILPAIGQGVLTLQCRKNDTATKNYLMPLNHIGTERCVTAERALLFSLGGNCHTPIGGHATIQKDGHIRLDALIASHCGTTVYRTVQIGEDAHDLGQSTAKILKDMGGPRFWSDLCIS
jgi:hydroxymethylbilane synthase